METENYQIPSVAPKKKFPKIILIVAIVAIIFGAGGGFLMSSIYWQRNVNAILGKEPVIKKETVVNNNYIPQTTEEQKTINLVKDNSSAVVSIIISKDVPIYETYYIDPFGSDWPFNIQIPQYKQKGTEKQEVGGGTGFIIASDGMVLTNKHVVSDKTAEYTVLTNDGKKYPATILAIDQFYDLALIKIDQSKNTVVKTFPTVKLGDSTNLQIGQSVVAIGNALAEFQNTVSVGVISGLGRTITASGGGADEVLEDIIQTDAAINPGNSGGPLLNLAGEVIGINVAKSNVGENIGFAIPINRAKKAIEQVRTTGKIVYPFLGVYYTIITPDLQEKYKLGVDYGAWIGRDASGKETEEAVMSGSPAQKAGLKSGDIILKFGSEKVTLQNTLSKIIQEYKPGDIVSVIILRDGSQKTLNITLVERT